MTDRVAIEVPREVARILMDRSTLAAIVGALMHTHVIGSALVAETGVDLSAVATAFLALNGEVTA